MYPAFIGTDKNTYVRLQKMDSIDLSGIDQYRGLQVAKSSERHKNESQLTHKLVGPASAPISDSGR